MALSRDLRALSGRCLQQNGLKGGAFRLCENSSLGQQPTTARNNPGI